MGHVAMLAAQETHRAVLAQRRCVEPVVSGLRGQPLGIILSRTNMAPERGSLQEALDLPGTLPQVPC